MRTDLTANRCKGRTKAGKPCKAYATQDGLCLFHAHPEKASQYGRVGGRKNRRQTSTTADPLLRTDSAADVVDITTRLVNEAYSGAIPIRTAKGIAPLLHLRLRAIENANLETQIAELRNRLDAAKVK